MNSYSGKLFSSRDRRRVNVAIHPCPSCDTNCNVLKLAAYQRRQLSVYGSKQGVRCKQNVVLKVLIPS
jgi:hypothetical protein